MSSIETRLARLETSQRRWRMAALVLGFLVSCTLAMGAKGKDRSTDHRSSDRLSVRHLDIVNESGRTVIQLRVNDRGDGVVEVHNNRGKLVSVVGANFRGDGLINAANNRGDWVSAVGATDRGDGIVETFHVDGKVSAILGSDRDGDGVVRTFEVGDRRQYP